MGTIIALIAVLANVVTASRLVCYRRHEARYRPVISFLAWLMMVCAFGQVVEILVKQTPVTTWQAGFSVVVAVLVWRARGNVAAIVRCV